MRALALLLLLSLPLASLAADTGLEAVAVEIPDVRLLDQDGREVALRDVLAKRRVLVNFVYTTCSTVCSPMTAIFSQLQRDLGSRGMDDVHLVSITLDPAIDTPERLKAYADGFGRKEGWTFLTGRQDTMARVLRAMGGHVGEKSKHAPFTLLKGERGWFRLLGIVGAPRLIAAVEETGAPPAVAADVDEAGRRWFTDAEVVDQDGVPHRFYSDLIRGNTVMIHFAFTSCKGACSPIARNLVKVQRMLAGKRDVKILTLSVDPLTDTPKTLKEFARKVEAGPGWHFLTGVPETLEGIRRRLGDATVHPDEHPMVLLIGNVATGNWIKAMATDDPGRIAEAVIHLDDP